MRYITGWLLVAVAFIAFLWAESSKRTPLVPSQTAVAELKPRTEPTVPPAESRPAESATETHTAIPPLSCVSQGVEYVRGIVGQWGDTYYWNYVDFTAEKLAGQARYAENTILIGYNINCATVAAVAFHEWLHMRMMDYYGGIQATIKALPCGPVMPEYARTCRSWELLADCGSLWLTTKYDLPHMTPYRDKYGCPNELLALAKLIIKGEK